MTISDPVFVEVMIHTKDATKMAKTAQSQLEPLTERCSVPAGGLVPRAWFLVSRNIFPTGWKQSKRVE